MHSDRLIICITGMPGAGKTTAISGLNRLEFESVSMGDVVREEAKKRGFGLDAEGQRRTQKLLRDEGGPGAIAELCARKIVERGLKRVLIDGVRSIEEVKTFSRIGTVKILCIHASPPKRFEYLSTRGRKDDPRDREEFERRDNTELALGVGNVIALADRVVENEVISVEELQRSVEKIVGNWLS
ncbi:MAG: AAA family ATPase [Conexivisphaerales archaeon]